MNELMTIKDKTSLNDQLDIFFGFYGDYISDEKKAIIRDYLKTMCGFAWGMGYRSGTDATIKIMTK